MADATPATNATNHTRYFNLPLFISTDRPSWLVDWNGAMGEIDTILNDIATTSEGASSAVSTIKTQIDTLSATVTSLNTIVETAVSDVASMQTAVDSVETRLDKVESDLITQNNLIKTLSDTVITMQSTVSTLENHVDTLNDTVTAMGVNVNAIQTALTSLQTTVSSLDTRVTALENASSEGGFPASNDPNVTHYVKTILTSDIDPSTAKDNFGNVILYEDPNDEMLITGLILEFTNVPTNSPITLRAGMSGSEGNVICRYNRYTSVPAGGAILELGVGSIKLKSGSGSAQLKINSSSFSDLYSVQFVVQYIS